jgi:hypothetical protein
MAAVWATARRELDDGHNLTCSVRGEQLATEAATMRIAAFPAKIARLGGCGRLQRGVCLALAEILLDPLTVEGGEDGRWRARSLSGDADAPAQNIDLPNRIGVRKASRCQRSSEAQCIFGSAFTV